ncbi:MAG TPA: TonB-dependent receptor [Polyangiales bacterium]|nr:TonB-dependent receptor [Polyangiales bacterium]
MGRRMIWWRAIAALCTSLAWAVTAGAQPTPPTAAPTAPAATPPVAPAAPAPTAPASDAPPAGGPAAAPPASDPTTAVPADGEVVAPGVETGVPTSTPAEPPADAPVAAEAELDANLGAAAETSPAAEAEPDASSEEIVVTGSRIKRTSQFAPAASVQVVDRKQLEFSGAQNLGDVVQHLTAAGGSDFNGRSQGGWGVSQVNLRGLGPQATLVLINGRRVVSSAIVPQNSAGNIVDVAQIPISAIERVEVMRAGGSAIYGADAVAGVVNIITRKDYEGLRIEGGVVTTEEFDHSEYSAGATLGASSERARATLSVGVTRQSELLATDRDWTEGRAVAQIGNPATFITTQLQPDPDCLKAPSTFVAEQPGGGAFCSIDARGFGNVMQPMERITTLGYGEYDLSDHTMVFLELGLSSLRAQAAVPPSLPVLQPVYVPANHPDNPFGMRAQYLGSPITAASGIDALLSEEDTVRIAAGFKGDFEGIAADTFAEQWEWELAGTWGRAHLHGLVPDIVTDRFQTALDSCSDPLDLTGCFNPFYSASTGEGTPNSKAVTDSFRGNMQYVSDSWMATTDLGLTGPLFELPGGDFSFAIGGQYRYEERQSDVDHDGNADRYGFVLGNADASTNRNIGAGYLELLWPFYDGIELQTAARVEHYETIGTSASPQASLVIIPAEIAGRDNVVDSLRRLRLRGTITRAFRAPALYEVYPGYTTTIRQFDDEGPVPTFAPNQVAGNPTLDYETALVTTGGLEWSPVQEWGLSVDYWRYAYNDRISEDDILKHYREDRFNPDYFERGDPPQRLLERAHTTLINQPGEIVTQGLDFGTAVKLELDEVGITSSEAGTFSFAVDGSYVLSYDVPRETVADIQVNDEDPNDDEVAGVEPNYCDGDTCDVAGLLNQANFASSLPRLRLNVPVSWNDEHHSVALIVHYVSSYEDDSRTVPDRSEIDADDPQYELQPIDAMVTIDLSYGYTLKDVIGEATTLRIGVINLLDQDPPTVNLLAAYDVYTHDPRGRTFYARLTQEF